MLPTTDAWCYKAGIQGSFEPGLALAALRLAHVACACRQIARRGCAGNGDGRTSLVERDGKICFAPAQHGTYLLAVLLFLGFGSVVVVHQVHDDFGRVKG